MMGPDGPEMYSPAPECCCLWEPVLSDYADSAPDSHLCDWRNIPWSYKHTAISWLVKYTVTNLNKRQYFIKRQPSRKAHAQHDLIVQCVGSIFSLDETQIMHVSPAC